MIKTIFADGVTEYDAIDSISGRGEESGDTGKIEATVREIIDAVRERGDEALFEYSVKFDGILPEKIKLTRDEMRVSMETVDKVFLDAIMHAAENIKAYHVKQKLEGYEKKDAQGNIIGQIVRGLDVVGLYVPGGSAAYPSTVLMNGIPAVIAGVSKVVMVTPNATDEVLAAAYVAGVDEVYLVGGAQAVAALAYGTETIPRADKIVGPGNVYVATAKRMLFGTVDIDMIAGPSEVLIVADETADSRYVAADMLAQAEHDVNAAALLLTTSEKLAGDVDAEIARQLPDLARREIAENSIESNGLIVVCKSDDKMLELANLIAPEHLEILTENPLGMLPEVRNAGSVFLGPWSPEALGDYYSGTNHVLPTSGTARYASPLGVHDFLKRMSYTMYTKEGLESAKDDIVVIGNAEGLGAHVASVKKRFE